MLKENKRKNKNKTTQTLDDVACPLECSNEFILTFFVVILL